MKKIALFVSVLLLAGSLFAAAPVFEAKPGISGDATMTFGIALDTAPNAATGITNATSSNITLGLINKDSNEKGGAEGEEVYGWIKLKDFEMKIDGSLTIAKPGIEAKLFLGPVYINILGVENKVSKAGVIKAAVVSALTVDVANTLAGEHQGIAIGLKDTAIVDVVLGVNSLYDWTATAASSSTTNVSVLQNFAAAGVVPAGWEYVNVASGFSYAAAAAYPAGPYACYSYTTTTTAANMANVDNVYQFYLAVGLKAVPNLTFDVAANFASTTAAATTTTTIGAGAKAAYKITIAEGITVEPYAAFDLKDASVAVSGVTADVLSWQLDAGLTLGLPGDKKKVTFAQEIEYAPGLTAQLTMMGATASVAGVSASADGSTDLGVYFFDGSIVPVANVLVAFEMTNLSALTGFAGAMGVGVWANADLGQVAPWAQFSYKQPAAAGSFSTVKLEIGADIKVITNTTFTLKYTNAGLGTDTVPGTKGTITFATKIAY